jgi:hypothetical protein
LRIVITRIEATILINMFDTKQCASRIVCLTLFCIALNMASLVGVKADESTVHRQGSRIMILMEEKIMGVFGTTGHEQIGHTEAILAQYFRTLGFKVLDAKMVKRNITQSQGLRMLEGDDAAAAAVGLQHGAQYSILGTALSKPAGAKLYGSQIQTIHATVTARVVRNDDAQVIATGSAQAAKAHIDEVRGGTMALEEALNNLAQDLSGQILATDTQGRGGAAQEMTLLITGLVSYRHLDFVMDYLEKKVPGVKQVQLNSFTSGVAELSVDYTGPMKDLARRLATERFRGFRLEPTHVTVNRRDIKAVLQAR